MKRGLHLYIEGNEVDLQSSPQILFNYAVDEVANPSVVKNTYSKSIELPGTERNNRIFQSIFSLDQAGWNGGKKINFQIFVDNELYEEGYCRLDKVRKQLNGNSYTISLFGGLGSAFYTLSYKEDENGVSAKKTLADLVYRYEGEGSQEVDFDFVINKDTVWDAWSNVEGWSTKWRFINFAPAYNGLPDDFDADKVLVEAASTRDSGGRGSGGPSVTESGKTYTTYGGYYLAELPREYTESEMREFRSYLQRPVVRCMEVVKACCLPENNGGYKINLDPDFFNNNNPYWYGTWCTLPMLTSFDYIGQKAAPDITAYLGGAATALTSTEYIEDRNFVFSGSVEEAMSVNVNITLKANIPGATADSYSPTAYSAAYGVNYYGAVLVQLVAYDAFGRAVAGSDVKMLCSGYGSRRVSVGGRSQIYTVFPELENFDWTAPYSNTYERFGGTFKKIGGDYVWTSGSDSTIQLKADNIPAGSTLRLEITKIRNENSGTNTPRSLWEVVEQGGQYTQYFKKEMSDFTVELNSMSIKIATNETIRTDSLFTKKTVLSTDFTPADFLLDYCKLFGLMFRKHPSKKEIDILTRENFFNGGLIDAHGLIDRSDISINPVAFNKKWYKFGLQGGLSEYGENYKKVYGGDYGDVLINVGYDFNTETEDVFKENIFRTAVQCTEKSPAYAYDTRHSTKLPFTFFGYSYLLFEENDSEDTKEVEVPATGTIDILSGMTNYDYFDRFSKVQLHTKDNSPSDGKNVLLFFDGWQDLTAPDGQDLGYYITDDVPSYMSILNDGNPCWLYTRTETDGNGNSIAKSVNACPRFGRYIIYEGSGYITKSLDFGEPQTVYIPGATSTEDGTMYSEFWKDYISDVYDKDTRVVTAKMLFNNRVTVDDLRYFYYIDGSIFRLSKISDWNMLDRGLTSVELVKVNNVDNYKSKEITYDPALVVTLSAYDITADGATISFTAMTSDNGAWYAEIVDDDNITMTPDHASGSTTGTITIGNNYGSGSYREYVIWFFADPASVKVVISQEDDAISIGWSWSGGDIPASGATVPVTIQATKPWSAASPYNYVTLAQTTGDSGTTNTTATWSANTGNTYRDAYLTISSSTRTSRSSTLHQKGVDMPYMVLSADYDTTAFPASGGVLTFTVIDTNVEDYWAYTNQAWATFTNGNNSIHLTGDTIEINIQPNAGESSRYFWFQTSANVQMTVTQEGTPPELPYMIISPSSVTDYPSNGGTVTFNIVSTNVETWWAYSSQSWALFSNGNANMSGTSSSFTMTIAENTTHSARTATLLIRDVDTNATVKTTTIEQEADVPMPSNRFMYTGQPVVPRELSPFFSGVTDSTLDYGMPYTATTYGDYYGFETENPIVQISMDYDGSVSEKRDFGNCTGMTSFIASDALEVIGASAFRQCTNLSGFTAEGVTRLRMGAFYGCTALKEAHLENVTYIGDSAFQDCTGLTDVYVSTALTKIAAYAFGGITGLTVHYDGTTSQWNSVTKVSTAFRNTTGTIQCSNGNITI